MIDFFFNFYVFICLLDYAGPRGSYIACTLVCMVYPIYECMNENLNVIYDILAED